MLFTPFLNEISVQKGFNQKVLFSEVIKSASDPPSVGPDRFLRAAVLKALKIMHIAGLLVMFSSDCNKSCLF